MSIQGSVAMKMNREIADGNEEGKMTLFTLPGSENVEANEIQGAFVNPDEQITGNHKGNLFRVMRIVHDKQDYSFVEKVQLPQDEIVGLCNKLVPKSASAYLGDPPRITIDFNGLNEKCLPAVGFYGDKHMMTQIFRKECLLNDTSVLDEMESDKFKPGLYVIVREEAGILVVFYWHEGQPFTEASRKDASCNFIRYLVELCDCVHICVKGSYNFEALAVSTSRPPLKNARARAFEVKKINHSKNDAELLPGFNVRIAGQAKLDNLMPVFSEGYHRCCFLTAEDRAERISTRGESAIVRVSEFDRALELWSTEGSVNFSKLTNQSFVSLLRCCKPREYDDYCNFRNSFKDGKSVLVSPQVETVEKCFLKVLPEFCGHVFLLLDPVLNVKEPHSSEIQRFDELHREFSVLLRGQYETGDGNGDCRVLLLRSDIKFTSDEEEQHIITVESSEKGKPAVPYIQYGKEVNAKCSNQCRCLNKLDAKAKFVAINEHNDFLFSGKRVKLQFTSSGKSHNNNRKTEMQGAVEVVQNSGSASVIRSWVEHMVPNELKTLEENIDFAAFLFGHNHKESGENFIKGYLKADNRKSLPVEFEKLFNQFQVNSPPGFQFEQLSTYKQVQITCNQVYNDQRYRFLENVKRELSSVLASCQVNKGQNILSSLLEKVTRKDQEKEREFQQAENKFLWKLRERMNGGNSSLLTRYIEEFSVHSQQNMVNVKSLIKEVHQSAVVFKACELTAMRKALDKLSTNPDHLIVPTIPSGESVELVAINPKLERLLKVVCIKSGELMIFIHNLEKSLLYLYRCSKIGFNINNQRPIHTFKRGFDLLSVDEDTRSVALYDKDMSKVAIYKFDDSFRGVYSTGVEINLELYVGSKLIRWMQLIPRKMQLLLVDDTNRVRVVEIHEKPMMKPKPIYLSTLQPHPNVCISSDGVFFFVFRQLQASGYVDGTEEELTCPGMTLDIYVLGDTMDFLKSINLSGNLNGRTWKLENLAAMKVTSFGSQSHLVLYNPADAPGFLSSNILKTFLDAQVVQVQEVQREQKRKETAIDGSCPYLAYIYHIFDKFGTTPALFPEYKREVIFKVVLENSEGEGCKKYMGNLVRQLEKGKGKDFANLKLQFEVENLDNRETKFNFLDSVPGQDSMKRKLGVWLAKLICLVPIQICRTENNGMVALKDGLQIPPHISYVNSISLAKSVSFGFYDTILNSWKGKIRVISTMGKQSSGKSYLLNHLSGSLLDVSGGRCTDGVWMSITTGQEGYGLDNRDLFVVLDFEGLGSFERTEQEDMLLSVLNAAVSNLTIFNKKDFHLDKDTESAFGGFQSGINLFKQDKKLFRGLLYIAIKDVDGADVDDLLEEFHLKIDHICSKSEDNFILKMYDGKFKIAGMSPFHLSDYYEESLREIAETAYEKVSSYDNGLSFLRDLKLIIAQIAAKDWSPVDSKRVAFIVYDLKKKLTAAVSMGCLSVADSKEVEALVKFDTQEEIPDFPLAFENSSVNVLDSGLRLSSSIESSISVTGRDVLTQLKSTLETVLPRKGSNGELWHSKFEKFLELLAERRCDRVHKWISSNTVDFCDDDEVKRLQLEAHVALAEVKQGLAVCGCKCLKCFYKCVLEKGHDQSDSEHDCMGTHSCTESCSYCAREGGDEDGVRSLRKCGELAGHEGDHDCREKNHPCGEICALFEKFSHCNQICSLKPEHSGQHMCNSPQHMCKMTCSHPNCNNPCAAMPKHEKHQCHEKYCQSKCSMKGCNRTCGVRDHFHGVVDLNAEHLCGNEHACPEKCQAQGICEISTELKRQTRRFEGQRGSLEYEDVSEQIELRKDCCIPIPPFQRSHPGPHVHNKNEDSMHYCNTRCEGCGYFCQLPIDHPGLHDTVHGNMRNVRFILEEEDTGHQYRMHKYGENVKAEICNMYCRKQGRGHIHLLPCPGSMKCTSNLYNGSRHQSVKYGPDVDVPKDEMTHKTYWQHLGFVDLCTLEEGREYGLCNHYCNFGDHEADGGISYKSYCTKELWHQFININSAGYMTADTHHFPCHHPMHVPRHVIFVIDKSSSMGTSDITPTMAKFREHNNRLGCAYEAILRFIRTRLRTVSNDSISVVLFDKSSTLAVEIQDMKDNVVDSLLQYHAAKFIHREPVLEVGLDAVEVGLDAVEVGLDVNGQIQNVLPNIPKAVGIVQNASKIPGWGTCYCSGLEVADEVMRKASTDTRFGMKIPTIIFFSDGGITGKDDPVSYVEEMTRQEPRMKLHTILYGKPSAQSILEAMAKAGNGEFHLTQNAIQLAKCFENLAKSLGSKDLTSHM